MLKMNNTTEIVHATECDKSKMVAKIEGHIAEILDDPKAYLVSLYGESYGVAKLVRDERLVRVFVKEIQPAKSGKAMLVEIHAWIHDSENNPLGLVRGITYLPNFVVTGKDVYWIVSNKIHNVTSKNFDTNSGHEAWIDKSYIPKEFNMFKNFWSQNIDYHPEDAIFRMVDTLESMKK
tara:strand:+ start:131 stop:664 length:534 start_codon:yes stop_codon:yes gene_type:complete